MKGPFNEDERLNKVACLYRKNVVHKHLRKKCLQPCVLFTFRTKNTARNLGSLIFDTSLIFPYTL